MAADSPSESSSDSVTQWIGQLKAGEPAASQHLWRRYIEQLVQLAGYKLGSIQRAVADEEDVALSAFRAFLGGVQQARFPKLHDRDDLWQVLAMLTERKAVGIRRYHTAEKRGAHKTLGDEEMGRVAAAEPTPEFAALFRDEVRRLFGMLDAQQHHIALGKMAGFTNAELANELGISLRAVERKLQLIRHLWQEER